MTGQLDWNRSPLIDSIYRLWRKFRRWLAGDKPPKSKLPD